MTDELKPCPTCGQRAYTYIGKDGKSVLVFCVDMPSAANDAAERAIAELKESERHFRGAHEHMDWMRRRHARRMWVMWGIAASSILIALGAVLYG